MLEEKAPAPEYGTYQYSALADSMGIGMAYVVCCVGAACALQSASWQMSPDTMTRFVRP